MSKRERVAPRGWEDGMAWHGMASVTFRLFGAVYTHISSGLFGNSSYLL